MKKWKQMLAIMLAVIMTLAMTVTASAAETTQKGSLTVNANENNTLKGQTIRLYKLFGLTIENETNYTYAVNGDYTEAIKAALNVTEVPAPTDQELCNKIQKLSGEALQNFANALETAFREGTPKETTFYKITNEETSHTFTDLEYGYYLVYLTGTQDIQSSLVLVDNTEVSVNLKGTNPSIDKKVDKEQETVEIGEVVRYTITGTIPDTTGYVEYVYKIHDTLTDGLDFVKNQDGTALDEPTKLPVSVQITGKDTQEGEITAELSGNGNRTMTLDLSEWIRNTETQNHKGKTFTVTYYAKVNKNAVVTTHNEAKLEYGNDPNNTTTTTPVVVTTPTYPLQIHKQTKGQPDNYLAGATFRLYKNKTDADAMNENAIKVTGDAGNYIVAENQKEPGGQMDMVSVGTDLNGGMNLKLNGLKAGDYWLVETKAPDGYHGVTTPIKITIAKSADEDENNWTISKDTTPEGDKIIDIENSTGTILPGTGGMGTILFTVVGVALILVVAVSFVISRRKRQEQE